MSIGLDQVLQETSDLHRFVGTLVTACGIRRPDYPVFSRSAIAFFGYIHKLGLQTQAFLNMFPDDFAETTVESIQLSKLQKLKTLRKAWERLHEYVKPALDADSLNLPMPLIEALEGMVRKIDDWKEFEFVYFHTSEANYLQVPSERAKDIADLIALEVGGEQFPITLGLVGIPYSQANTFFLNCLLPHEFGHFLYAQSSWSDIEPKINTAMEKLDQDLQINDDAIFSDRRDTLVRWLEETFCDLVALCLIGPAFSFAYSELTSASTLLGRSDSDLMEFFEFSQSYPSDAARFHVHFDTLVKLGWWQEIQELTAAPIQVLKRCEKWSDLSYVDYAPLPDDQISDSQFIEVYQELAVWLVDYVISILGSAAEAVKDYKDQFAVIGSYLERAVVPSTIITPKGTKVYPSPAVLMNAGYCFKLKMLPKLLERIIGRKTKSVKDSSELSERLELWILKALEDNKLLTGQMPHVSRS